MSNIPKLSKSDIMRWIGSASFMRAQTYVRDGSMVYLRQTGEQLKAHCQEYMGPPYQVEVNFSADEIVAGSCSCPMGSGGQCKHVGALLITWLEEPEAFRRVESLEVSLEQRSKAELVLFIRQLVQHDPLLATRLEVPGLSRNESGIVTVEIVKQHVKNALESIALDEWGAYSWIAAELSHVVHLGDEYLSSKEWNNAITVYQVVAHELLTHYKTFDDQEGQLQGIVRKCVFGLGLCLAAIDDPTHRESIFQTLFDIYRWQVHELGLNKPYNQVTDIMLALGTEKEKEKMARWLQTIGPSEKGLSPYSFDRLRWTLGS